MNHLLENWQNKKNGILTTESPKKTLQIQKKERKEEKKKTTSLLS
jgi:hypothetical protein